MSENWWKIVATAFGAILIVMMTYFINSNSQQWAAIGNLKERVACLEGMHRHDSR